MTGDREGKFLVGFLCLLTMGALGYLLWVRALPHRKAVPIQEKLLTAHDQLFGIDFHGASRGWIVGNRGLILHTNNGGGLWQRQPSGTTRALTAVSFISATNGVVVGSKGVLLKTANGGITWTVNTAPVREQLLDVDMVNPSRAYSVGAFGTILSTSDGGKTWSRHQLPWARLIPSVIKESGFMEPNLNGVEFVSPKVGWVVGEFGLILCTTDGGRTWFSQRHGRDLPQLFRVAFSDRQSGWAIGQQGTILHTIDGGKNWLTAHAETERDLYGIALENGQGVIAGDGVILKSLKLGNEPFRVDPSPGDRWLSGVAINQKRATLVGQFGTLFQIDLSTRES